MNKHVLLLWVLAGCLMSGCVSTGMARTLDKGEFQLSFTPGVQHLSQPDSPGNAGELPTGPRLEFGARYGVTDRFDVGAHLFNGGAAVDVRLALLRSPTLEEGVDLTLAPTFVYTGQEYAFISKVVELPLLLGLNLGGGTQLVISPKLGHTIVSPSRYSRFVLGGSLGVAVALTRWLRLVPEVSARTIDYPEDNPYYPATPDKGHRSLMYHAGIGLLVGGYGWK